MKNTVSAIAIADRLEAIVARLSITLDNEELHNDANGIRHFCAACSARNEINALIKELRA